MTTSPRAVIFDFGGVIWNMEWEAARALEAEHALPQGSLRATLYDGDAWSRLQRGRGDRDAWLAGAHRALEQVAGRPLPPLHAQWRATHGPIAENIALIRVLRPRHRTSILSNSDTTLRERLGKVLGIAGLFDDIVCSAEIGLVKPEPEIYALACDRHGLPPDACVFVDDHEPNVAAAAGAGLRAILYRVDRGDDLRAQLAAADVGVSAS